LMMTSYRLKVFTHKHTPPPSPTRPQARTHTHSLSLPSLSCTVLAKYGWHHEHSANSSVNSSRFHPIRPLWIQHTHTHIHTYTHTHTISTIFLSLSLSLSFSRRKKTRRHSQWLDHSVCSAPVTPPPLHPFALAVCGVVRMPSRTRVHSLHCGLLGWARRWGWWRGGCATGGIA
jgi:hypothetical protein